MHQRVRGSAARLAVAAMAVTVPALALETAPPSGATTSLVSSITAGPGDYVGGGTINVIARASDGHLIAGGDSQGLYRNTDGTNWSIANVGVTKKPWTRVAAVAYAGLTTTNAKNVWLAAVGDAGSGGAGTLLASSNDGASWYPVGNQGTLPFEGGDADSTSPGVPDGHPRSVGHLLQVVNVAGVPYLFAGTFNNGVARCQLTMPTSPSDTLKCASSPVPLPNPSGLTGNNYIRSLAYDSSTSTLYAASYNWGILKYTSPATAPTASVWASNSSSIFGTTAVSHVEELAVAPNTLIAVGSGGGRSDADAQRRSGIAFSRTSGSPVWSNLGTAAAARTYTSVATSTVSSTITVLAGSCSVAYSTAAGSTKGCLPSTAPSSANQLMRFSLPTTGALTATGVTDMTTKPVSPVFPRTGTQLGGSVWVSGDILLDGTTAWLTGRGAIYKGGFSGLGAWATASQGLPATFTRRIAVGKTTSGEDTVAFTDADWIQVSAGQGLTPMAASNIHNVDTVAPDGSAGLEVAWGQDPSGALTDTLITSSGYQQDSNIGGAISIRPSLTTGATLVRMPGTIATTARPDALDAQVDGGLTRIAAWFEGDGLQLYNDQGSPNINTDFWTHAAPTGLPPAFTAAANLHPRDVQVVWAARNYPEPSLGVFVSAPGGGVWRYVPASSQWFPVTNDSGTYLIAGQGKGSQFALITASGQAVTRYTFTGNQTNTTTTTRGLPLTAGTIAGLAVSRQLGVPMVVTTGKSDGSGDLDLYRFDSTLSATGVSTGAGTRPEYQSQARFPSDLAVSVDGSRAYVSTVGQGVVYVNLLAP